MIGTLVKIVFARLLPFVILAVAIFVGWLNTFPIPEATLFSMVYPVMKGYVPPVLSGGYKDCPVIPVPESDFQLEARPTKEAFVRMPGLVLEEVPVDSASTVVEGETETETEKETTTTTEASAEIEAAKAEIEAANARALAAFSMPQQGIGMCCRHTAYDAESVRRTILWYLKVGGRHIDTADIYLNHAAIGEALQIAMKEYKIPRQEIWVTTKLWPRFFGDNSTMEAIPRFLKELQLDYIDLVLMHAPSSPLGFLGAKSECTKKEFSPKECRQETWRALTKVRELGLVKHVGVSNFNVRQLKELLELENVAPIANNQFQYNPWVPDKVHQTFDFCRQNGITVTAWSSFAGTALQHMAAFSVETLETIAKNHATTVAQILLKWALQRGAVVIPGTANPKHMRENLAAFQLDLSEQEMREIDNLRKDESARKFFLAPEDET